MLLLPLFLGLAVLGFPLRGAVRADTHGDPARGRIVFEAKQCARCHLPRGRPGAGPALEAVRKPQGALELVGRLWNHVPPMFSTLAGEGIEWPKISAGEMAHLMAYLGADPARDPVADPGRGHGILVRKGCLKCHSLRGEGGPVGPDLAARRSDYESASAWAAAMWAHTPRMAQAALARGVLYPRFVGDEMTHLLGVLGRATTVP